MKMLFKEQHLDRLYLFGVKELYCMYIQVVKKTSNNILLNFIKKNILNFPCYLRYLTEHLIIKENTPKNEHFTELTFVLICTSY